MVLKQKDIHPKLSSRLWYLKKEYEKPVTATQAYSRSATLRAASPEKITVYLISEPGKEIDKAALRARGAEIVKSSGNVCKARVPVNKIETIADNVNGIAFIKLPDRPIPLAVESEGVDLTWASAYHSAVQGYPVG